MIIIDLVLVLVLGLEGLVLVLVFGLECLVLVLVLEGQVLVNITDFWQANDILFFFRF